MASFKFVLSELLKSEINDIGTNFPSKHWKIMEKRGHVRLCSFKCQNKVSFTNEGMLIFVKIISTIDTSLTFKRVYSLLRVYAHTVVSPKKKDLPYFNHLKESGHLIKLNNLDGGPWKLSGKGIDMAEEIVKKSKEKFLLS